jgi:hypothetical protein
VIDVALSTPVSSPSFLAGLIVGGLLAGYNLTYAAVGSLLAVFVAALLNNEVVEQFAVGFVLGVIVGVGAVTVNSLVSGAWKPSVPAVALQPLT